jgi:hypothetical protein
MKKILFPLLIIAITFSFSGCKKWSTEHRDIYTYSPPAANPVSDAAPLCGSVKGTMLTGKTYSVGAGCDLVINAGDTLLMQPGVTLNMGSLSTIIALGVFVSNGSQAQPNWIHPPNIVKTDQPGANPATDPAYSGIWGGIIGGPACSLLVLRWTHVEFAGASESATTASISGSAIGNQYTILFANYNGNFIMEDSWLYGGVDDEVRVSAGKIAFFRNTYEKTGSVGGDCLNVKGGTVGTMAYNMFIGTATNGQKASNKGQSSGAPQTDVVMYNSTFISGGYRQTQTGRGADIDFEEGARGLYYNNVAVNCKFGYRVVGSPIADTAHLRYGNNYMYGDSLSVVNQFYPVGYITIPQPTDIPNPSYLPSNYYQNLGEVFDGTPVLQKNPPLFINFPLPVSGGIPLALYSAIGNYNFRLQSGSPLIGKGFTSFQPLIVVPLDPVFGLSEVTPPGADLGCYQLNGRGNQH